MDPLLSDVMKTLVVGIPLKSETKSLGYESFDWHKFFLELQQQIFNRVRGTNILKRSFQGSLKQMAEWTVMVQSVLSRPASFQYE
ncbi:hypothetical protein HPP92_022912 [Vanilla planifolia]|uniref:Uncharacterized protein n=1 Tax=Vanilla planifolia TaxID=51239 RepID=A0A835PU55_VANPL|nr:hypothetical protein HPP92_022912 [Vanilla planifolia]